MDDVTMLLYALTAPAQTALSADLVWSGQGHAVPHGHSNGAASALADFLRRNVTSNAIGGKSKSSSIASYADQRSVLSLARIVEVTERP